MKRFAVILTITMLSVLGSSDVSLTQHNHSEKKSIGKSDSLNAKHVSKASSAILTKADTTSTPRVADAKVAASMKGIVESYLRLKNALAKDNAKDGATAGKEMVVAIGRFDQSTLTAGQKKLYKDVEEDAREHAEHIGENAGNIGHQREHFDMLSKGMYDLVKAFGAGQTLYKDFCPMYDGNKGAMWLSETKTIRNPYYGKKMITCGSVKEELK